VDAGLRISEACSIKCKNFDFKNRNIPFNRKRVKHLRFPIKPALQTIGIFENNEISIESSFFSFEMQLGHISKNDVGSNKPDQQ
jgi:hypothetical protein